MELTAIFEEHIRVVQETLNRCQDDFEKLTLWCTEALQTGHTIYFMGNGGSAADCQHLAAEFIGRFQKERNALPALALTTDTSILTSVSNDYGFDQVFVRQVKAFVKAGDVVIGISTSGNSPNIINAIQASKERGAVTVGMTGLTGGRLAELCDICIQIPSRITARTQEAHILLGHALCEMVDEVTAIVP
jgi:D-sedoheptulose 7-phosphate isomerase